MKLSQQNKTDFLEIAIILAMFFLIIVIYVPVAIWEEEAHFRKESRHRMQNLYDVEEFYSRLIGSYNPNFLEAMTLINAARDSVVADSLFIDEQQITIGGKVFIVDIGESFEFEFDTTFGFKSFRKDTVNDTTVQIALYAEDLGRIDTSYIRKKDLSGYESEENFIEIVKEEPMKRVEAIEYYKTYLPDSSNYYCPLTNIPYQMEIGEDGASLKVSSPIKETIKESRYLLFSFKANSHGIIKDGQQSWD
ncbi:MAG: hypothetical protein ACKVLE_05790 [Fidelibacterota bacterium]|jgi:hypothetical protein